MKTIIYISAIITLSIFFLIPARSQVNGDFRTAQSGDWKEKHTWEVYKNGSWNNANKPPKNDASSTVTIRNGHTVVYDQSKTQILDLIVESGGKLYRNDPTDENTLFVNGNVSCNGTIGNGANNDALSLGIESGSCMISGSGDCKFFRLQKSDNSPSTSNLTIDMDVELYVTSGYSIFNNKNNTIFNISVNTNASLTSHTDINFTNGSKLITLYLKSDNTGYGSFISPSVTNSTTLNTTVERYITENKWHYISSPVDDANTGIFLDTYLKWFNEPDSVWAYIVNADSLLTTDMQGYAMWSSSGYLGNTTLQFVGTLNTGPKSISLTNTSAATHGSVGYNFIGNPYTSAIDWDYTSTNGWTKTNVDDAIYIWNSIAGSYGSYVNGVSTNGVTNVIPANQGFFIYCNTNPGVLGVDYGVQLVDNKAFMKSSPELNQGALVLSTEGNGYRDETVIKFDESATPLFDGKFDAYKMMGLIEAPQIFSIIENGENLSINTLPDESRNNKVKIGFVARIPGTYEITWDGLERINPDSPLYLEDKVTGEYINLSNTNAYVFNQGFNEAVHRFNLHFSGPIGIDEPKIMKINIYSEQGNIVINQLEKEDLNVKVFNLMGQEVKSQTLNSQSINKIHMDQTGAYIVKVYGNNFVETRKVFVK